MTGEIIGYQGSIWWVQETVKGATQSSATLKPLAQKGSMVVHPNGNPKKVPKSGSRDNVNYRKGIAKPTAEITCSPSKLNGRLFIKTFIDNDASFTILIGENTSNSNTNVYQRLVGSMIKRLTLSGVLYPEEDICSLELEVWSWSILNTQSATPSYSYTTGAGNDDDALSWDDCTVKVAGSTLTDWWDFSFTVEYELFRKWDNTGTHTDIVRGMRTCTGTVTRYTVADESVDIGKSVNATAVTVEIDLNADVYTFASSVFEDVPIAHTQEGMDTKKLNWTHGTFTVA